MGTVMSNKAMDMASNKVTGTASHKVMAMAATRAMDNMVVTVATKVMVIKVVMVATRAMDKVATVATRAMVAIKAMAMRVTVATKAMEMRATVATKAMATSLTRVMTKVTAINKAMTAMASNKVTQGAITEPTTDLTIHAPTTIRITGTKETMVATRAMDSKEATVETKAMTIKATMVATRATNNSLAMASSSLVTLRTRAPSTSKGLATPSNRRSNTIIIPAEITRRKAATKVAAREGISTSVTSLPSHTVKRGRATPWTWRRTPTAARATVTRTNTERDSALCRRLLSLIL